MFPVVFTVDNVQDYLKGKYPGAFEGWDEFEISIRTRIRKGGEPVVLVTLYNEAQGEYVVDIHACFIITEADDGGDNIRVGKGELYMEYNDAYVPEFAK